MATWPNGTKVFLAERRLGGHQSVLTLPLRAGGRLGVFTAWPKTSSVPDGYAMHGTTTPPYTAGGMSSWQRGSVTLTGTGALIQGGPMTGTGTVATLTGEAGLSLVVSLEGTAVVATLTGTGLVLSLTIGLNGEGSWALSGDGAVLALLVPMTGTGTVATLDGTGTDLRGRLSLQGEWTPFTALSPEGLAAAVWSSVLESGYTAEQLVRLIVAVSAGKLSGVDTSTPAFRDLADTVTRLSATTDSTGRTTVTIGDLD